MKVVSVCSRNNVHKFSQFMAVTGLQDTVMQMSLAENVAGVLYVKLPADR